MSAINPKTMMQILNETAKNEGVHNVYFRYNDKPVVIRQITVDCTKILIELMDK